MIKRRYLAAWILLLLLPTTNITMVVAKEYTSHFNRQFEVGLRREQSNFSQSQLSQKTDFEHESTDLIANVLYRHLSGLHKSMMSNGANGINVRWLRNQAGRWYIEDQRPGEELIIGGLIKNDPQAVEAGFKMFDWGFAHQVDDGSFSMTGDRFHSTSFFVEGVAHALLVIQQSSHSKQYAFQVAKYKPLVHRAARWMISSKVWEQGIRGNRPYTHRRYLVATALGLTSKLTGDEELIKYARKSIEDGLSLQRPDGVNPEKNGHDSSYQIVGVIYAQRWVMYFPQETITPKVVAMINKSLLWEQTRILPSGEISTEGNTRTAGEEKGRSGNVKTIDRKSALRAFAYWASVTGNQKWEESARQLAKFYYKMP